MPSNLKFPPQILGLVSDPSLNRDSGSSVLIDTHLFWTYRDTQLLAPDLSIQMFPIISSTASWSSLPSPTIHPSKDNPLKTVVLQQYGKNDTQKAYFHSPGIHLCEEPAGNRNDNSRIALWPDCAPLLTPTTTSPFKAYTWIKKSHIGFDSSVQTQNPGTILYKMIYDSGAKEDFPIVEIVDEEFWKEGEVPYGAYGNLVHEGWAYLYAQVAAGQNASLARVPVDFVERREKYEYWDGDTWTKTAPAIGQKGILIPNSTAGGQGTYFFNPIWKLFVWIGGDMFPGAEMYISTSPSPTGPWTEPKHFWTGPKGSHGLGAYSIQAHPGMCDWNSGRNEMYVTYTKNDEPGQEGDVAVYTTPLVYMEFELDVL